MSNSPSHDPTDLSRLINLRNAGAVTRYHTARMLRTQNLAEHSFGVALIILQAYPAASPRLLAAALYHDLAEVATGDLPAPVKWDNAGLKAMVEHVEARYERKMGLDMELSEGERHILKWADMFELVLWCWEEYQLGNTYALEIMWRGVHFLQHELHAPTPDAEQLLFKLLKEIK